MVGGRKTLSSSRWKISILRFEELKETSLNFGIRRDRTTVPVQWSQVVDHIGHPDRAAARMCGHLGNLAFPLSAHGGAGGKSIIIFFQLRK